MNTNDILSQLDALRQQLDRTLADAAEQIASINQRADAIEQEVVDVIDSVSDDTLDEIESALLGASDEIDALLEERAAIEQSALESAQAIESEIDALRDELAESERYAQEIDFDLSELEAQLLDAADDDEADDIEREIEYLSEQRDEIWSEQDEAAFNIYDDDDDETYPQTFEEWGESSDYGELTLERVEEMLLSGEMELDLDNVEEIPVMSRAEAERYIENGGDLDIRSGHFFPTLTGAAKWIDKIGLGAVVFIIIEEYDDNGELEGYSVASRDESL